MSGGRIRVALISFNFGEYCVRLANGLAQYADVSLLLPDRVVGMYRSALNDAVRLSSFHSPRLRQPVRQLRTMRRICRAITNFGPDLLHYQGGHLWFDLTLPLLRRYPLVFTVHDFRPHPGDRLSRKTPQWVETFARRHADQLIVHSKYIHDVMADELPHVADKTTVIPHIQLSEDQSWRPCEEEARLVLFFGRIWAYKGLEYLIRAEPFITSRVPDVQILIAGHGEDFSRYSQMMVHRDRFIVHNGFVPEERAAAYFRRASVVVLPYIEASQSGVIPMAYSAAKPVVATTVGGLPEMVEDGRTGYLVPPRNELQLADAVTRLLLNEPLRRLMGANGRRKIETECSRSLVARRTMEVYRRAIEGTARARRRLSVGTVGG